MVNTLMSNTERWRNTSQEVSVLTKKRKQMGYNTDWEGRITLSRPLSKSEQQEWDDICEQRHDSEYQYGDVRREFPSIWCGFEVTKVETKYGNAFSKTIFRWDGGEKTYEGIGWIVFFVEKLKEWSKREEIFGTGTMEWRGEEWGDEGRVRVNAYKDKDDEWVHSVQVQEVEHSYKTLHHYKL